VFVKPSVGTTDQLLLIDWAFACVVGDDVVYNGATHFVSRAVREHMWARHRGGAATYRYTPADDLHSWLLVCLWMANRAHLAAELRRVEEHFRGATPSRLERKQEVIAALFERSLAEWPWRPLHAAVMRMTAAELRPGAIDYSKLHDLIPNNRQLSADLDL
jgi:hypothetical protein